MQITNIVYDEKFEKEYLKLPKHIRKKCEKARLLFLSNPFHPSLRLHKLSGRLDGYWSISVDKQYRIMFRPYENGNVNFISVGTHAIYE